MKVLFDGIAMQNSPYAKFHGGGEYAKFVFKVALEQGYRFDVVIHNGRENDPEIDLLIEKYGISTLKINSKEELYNLIDQKRYERFFSALPYEYDDYKCKAQLIGVIHGLRKIELRHTLLMARMEPNFTKKIVFALAAFCPLISRYLINRQKKKFKKLLSITNSKFITVSETTKATLIHFFPNLDINNIMVVYSPFRGGYLSSSSNEHNYYLMLNANRYEKNIYMAIKALDHLFDLNLLPDKQAIVIGCDKDAFYAKVKNKDRFIFLPYLTPAELEKYYCNAYCLLYPSLNEGFGYPPLHSMSYGVPVLASSSTSIPEACDDAALFFSPTSFDDLCNRIIMLETDKQLYNKLKIRGKDRYNEVQNLIQQKLNDLLVFAFKN